MPVCKIVVHLLGVSNMQVVCVDTPDLLLHQLQTKQLQSGAVDFYMLLSHTLQYSWQAWQTCVPFFAAIVLFISTNWSAAVTVCMLLSCTLLYSQNVDQICVPFFATIELHALTNWHTVKTEKMTRLGIEPRPSWTYTSSSNQLSYQVLLGSSWLVTFM